MKYNGLLGTFPSEIKLFIGAFVVILSIGFYTGLMFVNETTGAKPAGITENYLGNEEDEDAEVMKFKKSKREMLTTVHTHILSMSFIFFLLGGLVWLTKLPKKLKLFLTIEPFLSVLLTFGGIYMLWSGMLWMKYIIMISGALMTLTFTLSALVILWQLIKKQATT
ncbi:hypothetical protein [Cellulophaga lytica]|uniref:Uncharacterized protein n=1 Tax=Cellulophaga lytica (strain ATCC 23178 / DSM 7489 / JCM 8516 / NBRC 14961 / NCIMB 1423 / VKM B-1433 / Cy l20) TaxID=867900 RepID=F0RFZ1_CELLC|nr:hypothetical protein [Cellulophaga lytica]ADY27951.1 hypothetical protein Celly_0116 [Cellulophaga lytica DSM 7489]AIM59031.1 hypothetical protein IX49_00240 [Cellulophaga lytica]WQG77859.1 hypothetical protein SR888_02810 [Cellulophaga lytica]